MNIHKTYICTCTYIYMYPRVAIDESPCISKENNIKVKPRVADTIKMHPNLFKHLSPNACAHLLYINSISIKKETKKRDLLTTSSRLSFLHHFDTVPLVKNCVDKCMSIKERPRKETKKRDLLTISSWLSFLHQFDIVPPVKNCEKKSRKYVNQRET